MASKKHTLDDQLQKYIQRARLTNRKSDESRKSSKRGWLGYTAAAGAAMATPAIGNAAIVYSGPQLVQAVTSRSDGTGQAGIDIDNDLVNDFTLLLVRDTLFTSGASSAHSFFRWDTDRRSAMINKRSGASGGILRSPTDNGIKLSSGSIISNGQGSFVDDALLYRQFISRFFRAFSSVTDSNVVIRRSDSSTTGSFVDSQTGFVGVSFKKNGNTHYGWIKIHVTNDLAVDSNNTIIRGDSDITALGWAYQDIPNRPILAGDTIPEPSSGGLALLAAGAAGIAQLRRKRSAKPDQDPAS